MTYEYSEESVQTQAPATETPASESPKKAPRKRPPMVLRAVFQLLCFVLCIALVGTLLATVLVADLRQMTSAGTIKELINALLLPQDSSAELPALPQGSHTPAALPLGAVAPDDLPSDIVDDIPTDILNGGGSEENVNALIDWLYATLVENPDLEVEFTAQEFAEFVEDSTLTDYMAEKLAGFAEDFINGTENTRITSDELIGLLEENEAPLKDHLNITLDSDTKTTLSDALEKVVEEQDLNGLIRDTVNEAVDGMMHDSLGMDVSAVQQMLQTLASSTLLWSLLLICLLLIAALCALNYYNIGAGFTWSAAAGLLAGGILSLPLLLIQLAYRELVAQIPELANVMDLLRSCAGALAPLHYGLLIGSGVVFLLSIVWRCLDRFVFHSNQ